MGTFRGYAWRRRVRHDPSHDPEVVETLIGDVEATYGVGEATYDRLVAKRDRRTIAVLDALKNTP